MSASSRLFVVLCASCAPLLSCKPKAEAGAAAMLLPEFKVSIGHPQHGDVPVMREWVGSLVSMAEAPIIPQVAGYIEKRLFTNGQVVQKGQVLYQIEPDLYEQAYQEAQQEVAALEAQRVKAQQNVEYYKPLVDNGSISRQTYTDAVQAERASAASLASAQAKAAQAKTNLSYCTLHAPMDGVVGFAKAFVGNYVSPASSSLVLVNVLNPIRVYFNISEQDWLNQGGENGGLRPDAKVDVLLANGKPYPHQAVIAGVDNRVEQSTGSLKIDARVPNEDYLLRPGMFVRVRAEVKLLKDVLLVPVAAVAQVQGKSMLLLCDEKAADVRMLPVELGEQQGSHVVIKKVDGDLSEESFIITNGTQQGLMAAMKRARLLVSEK